MIIVLHLIKGCVEVGDISSVLYSKLRAIGSRNTIIHYPSHFTQCDIWFEKSLLDLIKGLRTHKGNEREYVQTSIRECRSEIRGSDMDVKATALLKLIYLEMFGHDMSWASFHVLEVMSSTKYVQKRVGYLGAVQSFRPDTEVLMLATNLLKKDATSVSIPTTSLPLITLPHLLTPSLALSLLSDLLPRLGHSSPNIRKKTVVALYRLALVYPDALRSTWPRITEILMDEGEDPSVTAAVINVVCELGWRRPQDFLPMAPRFFDLLVDGGNNWMAIKIVKLFAALTPLEPRLVKKLLPPLMNLVKTTPAMSLLYECISGIIQGGILHGSENFDERDEVAELCVGKLRSMIAIGGDPNLKYVALLAFNKIAVSHPGLVASHYDVILSCVDDGDTSIRFLALQLGSKMIDPQTLRVFIDRLLKQLHDAQTPQVCSTNEVQPYSVRDQSVPETQDEDPELVSSEQPVTSPSGLIIPAEYRIAVIHHILDMCCRDGYANIVDFKWYIDVLVEITSLLPHTANSDPSFKKKRPRDAEAFRGIASAIGKQLQSVAVRVSSERGYAVQAADALLRSVQTLELRVSYGTLEALASVAWVLGEFSSTLTSPRATLDLLLLPLPAQSSIKVLCAYLQAIPKVLASVLSIEWARGWSLQLRTEMSRLLRRVAQYMEAHVEDPHLEVQERATGILELLRVCIRAAEDHQADNPRGPLILKEAFPSLYTGLELRPVAAAAQKRVRPPRELDLEQPISDNLKLLLENAENIDLQDPSSLSRRDVYHQSAGPATTELANKTWTSDFGDGQYGSHIEQDFGAAAAAALAGEKLMRDRNDPFYINDKTKSPAAPMSPRHKGLRDPKSRDVEIESIPIVALDIDDRDQGVVRPELHHSRTQETGTSVHVAAEETFEEDKILDTHDHHQSAPGLEHRKIKSRTNAQKPLLHVDSSGIGRLALVGNSKFNEAQLETRNDEAEDLEMAKALADVEEIRLEMQRASERIDVGDSIPAEGAIVTRKKKKGKKRSVLSEVHEDQAESTQRTVPKPLSSEARLSLSSKGKKRVKRKSVPTTEG